MSIYSCTFDTAQKMKFFIKDFFSKCDQIRRKLKIWSHLLKKSLMGNFIFCSMWLVSRGTERNALDGAYYCMTQPDDRLIIPWTHGVNWTYIRRSKYVLNVFWTSYVRSINVLCAWYNKTNQRNRNSNHNSMF